MRYAEPRLVSTPGVTTPSRQRRPLPLEIIVIRLPACKTPLSAQALCEQYAQAFVDRQEADEEAGDLETRLSSALRLSSLAARMDAAGLELRRRQIEDANKW